MSVLTFFREVRAEVSKITWPRRDELVGSCVIVFIFVVFFAIAFGGMDVFFSTLVAWVLDWFK